MTGSVWNLDQSDGLLLVHTGVTGRAARMGHRLTIAMTTWRATVRWRDGEPEQVDLAVAADSLEVLRGEGGVTPLSGPEKILARSNALKCLDADSDPEIRFRAGEIAKSADGYRLTGMLEIHGRIRERIIDLRVEDLGQAWHMSCEADVLQSEFAIKPFSMLMGSMKVADTVTVAATAKWPKHE